MIPSRTAPALQVPAAVLRVFLHLKFDKNLRSILDSEDGDQKGKKAVKNIVTLARITVHLGWREPTAY